MILNWWFILLSSKFSFFENSNNYKLPKINQIFSLIKCQMYIFPLIMIFKDNTIVSIFDEKNVITKQILIFWRSKNGRFLLLFVIGVYDDFDKIKNLNYVILKLSLRYSLRSEFEFISIVCYLHLLLNLINNYYL